jgi:hypothetical protein
VDEAATDRSLDVCIGSDWPTLSFGILARFANNLSAGFCPCLAGGDVLKVEAKPLARRKGNLADGMHLRYRIAPFLMIFS